MSIERTRLTFERDFTQIPNLWLRDSSISHRARGILGEIMSHSEGWIITVDSLVKNGPEGRDAITKAIKELYDKKYLELRPIREDGRLKGSTYVLGDPQRHGFSVPQKSAVEGATETRIFSAPESRGPENPHTKNTILQEDQEAEDGFDRFYHVYPRHVARGQAARAWKTATKKADPATIISAAVLYAQKTLDSDPKFIAHPATWLNGERWADDTSGPASTTWGYG